MTRTASAHWAGDLKSGKGTITSASGVLKETAYSFHTRFEDGQGTNPEELIAAAHAGCFTMALSLMLANEGLTADSLATECHVSLEKQGEGFAITKSALRLTAKIPGATQEAFDRATKAAKEGCPVSKLYNCEITLEAKLVA